MISRVNPVWDLTRQRVSGYEYACQKLKQKLQMFRGEWFLDVTQGVPWYEEILTKNPSFEVVSSILRSVALSVPGITSVTEVTLGNPDTDRVATASIRCKYFDGQPIDQTFAVRVI